MNKKTEISGGAIIYEIEGGYIYNAILSIEEDPCAQNYTRDETLFNLIADER